SRHNGQERFGVARDVIAKFQATFEFSHEAFVQALRLRIVLAAGGPRSPPAHQKCNADPGANEGHQKSHGDDERPRVFEHGRALYESRPAVVSSDDVVPPCTSAQSPALI